MEQTKQIAIFGGGCFWCTEAVFQQLIGVISVEPGYAGGEVANPTYEQVCAGQTGHAEVIKVEYNPAQVGYDVLLSVFFATHDPTTLNRQGNDVGTQYRSIILYTSEEQKRQAQDFIKKLEQDKIFSAPIVTEIKKLDIFYKAENYHKDYYQRNQDKPYCQLIINPKLQKLREKYHNKLKS
ncbi:MAG: peptide-methionine (S)-S-oxide reductase MsrA [Candidatus Buchananbacteria bacterium]|nr:peptide-methionine (S)-S-oxide reductase MsrA [Candidatus Buchananbacteria bacterium]